VTCHDGFTLYDLVSYNEKHNEANMEGNQDGCTDNYSWNCGVEVYYILYMPHNKISIVCHLYSRFKGETDNVEIQELRWRQRANMVATMLLSLGVPMLSGGDELSVTHVRFLTLRDVIKYIL
jgi:isoamylase